MPENHAILKAIAKGDKQAFQQLYTLFSEKVYNTALAYTQDEEDAEEITQDVFIKVFQNASQFRGDSAVNTWVYRITVNLSLNYIKKRKKGFFSRFKEVVIEKHDFEHPGVLLENKENAKALFKVIDTLPETQKTAFILSYIEDMPRQEVADVMETSLKAVESLLQRAKGNLKKKLENMYPHRRNTKK